MAKLRVDKIAAPIIKDEYTGSVYFDGAGDYLSIPDNSDFTLGSNDFTIEAWVYFIEHTDYASIIHKYGGTASNSTWFFSLNGTAQSNPSQVRFWVYYGSNSFLNLNGESITYNTWNHVAAVRHNNKVTLYQNGVATASSDFSETLIDSTAPVTIGGDYVGNYPMNGHVSNARVCKGHAVYTENFTPPTRELEVHTGAKGVVFPAADNRTVLLACQDAYNPTTEATGRHKITGVGHLSGDFGKNIVTNGEFTDGTTGWTGLSGATLSVENGKLKITESTGAADGYAVNGTAITTVVGVKYKIEWTFTEGTNTSFAVRFGNSGNQTQEYQSNSAPGGQYNNGGTYSFQFTATGTQLNLSFIVNQASTYGYVSNVSVVAVAPISEANPGLLRKTNTTSTITETTGSVYFDGTGDYIKSSIDSEDFAFSGDFAMECWVRKSGNGAHADSIGNVIMMTGNASNNRNGIWISVTNAGSLVAKVAYDTSSWALEISGGTLSNGFWHHVALTRSGSTVRLFLDGAQQASGSNGTDITTTYSNAFSVGGQFNPAGSRHVDAYVSNARICKGHPVYTSNFIPPTRELEVHEGPDDDRTVLLACYDGENIFADKTGRHIIAAYGDRSSTPTPASSDSPVGSTAVTPGLTREVDPTEGPTFGGGVGFVSQNWLTLPKGTTTQRSRGRGLIGGGYISNHTNTIEYIEINTLGNGQDFGDLSIARSFVTATSSSTRCLFHNGYDGSNSRSEIEYVNISTTGNATTFGSSLSSQQSRAGCGNNTRGIVASGSASNLIEYVTFSTLGDSKDFGDYGIDQYRDHSGCSSPTRGIFGGGFTPTNTNSIQYVTISTLGNSQDFGELSSARGLGTGAASSATRGVFFGGSVYPSTSGTNIIEYITISTQGNTTNFGDLTRSTYRMPCTSNGTRAVAYTSSPSPGGNAIEYITIATTGNAADFGDSLTSSREYSDSASSDSHGGIS